MTEEQRTAFSRFEIRPATVDDCPVIVEFNCRLASETEGKTLQSEIITAGVRALLDNSHHGEYFVALDGNTIVGQIMHTREWSDWRNGNIWWVQSVYVAPEYRNRGVFKSLLQHLEQLARNSPDVIGLRLYVETHNSRAQAAYQHLGFRDGGYAVMERIFRNDLVS